ncbi:hypothetical protein [Methylorubrum sp. DB1722]|uniref:hypothetical protein n=1 Tax=Methylorubrum sp. DB1722 TaxID=2478916 RepID=UPI0018E335D9|nr:hypothetical protein [Methylorubrum sp. DB1722]MBI1689546.1 hypothetical protein [Methylorubrum sp. DB1722]
MSSSSAPTPEAPPPPRVVTDAEVVALLRDAVREAGSQRAFVKAAGVNEGDLSSALNGKRPPSTALRRAVGVETALVLVGAGR